MRWWRKPGIQGRHEYLLCAGEPGYTPQERASVGPAGFFRHSPQHQPVMGADTGTIIKLDQARGMNKALQRMCDIAVKEVVDAAGKIAVVCHVNKP